MRVNGFPVVAVVALVSTLGALEPSSAEAQCLPTSPPSATCNLVGADGKGILGGAILGAEIGLMTNALIVNAGVRELDEWWAWVLFPALGSAGGGVLGYFALEEPNMGQGFPEAAVAVFAISMALVVPTFVGVLALTAYSPGPDQGGGGGSVGDEDGADEDLDDAPPRATPDEAAQSARARVLAGGPGVLRFDRGQVLLGVPMVSSADSFTAEERRHVALPQVMDLRVPVVSGVF